MEILESTISSTEYKNLIKKYEDVISKIKNLYSYLGNCSSAISICKPLMYETKIDGEVVDKGKLDNISIVLEDLKEAFNTIIAECKLKISSYEILYNIALSDEKNNNDVVSKVL